MDLAGEDDLTPLRFASAKGHEAVARLLLDRGAAVDLAERDGWTPLTMPAGIG